jgi:hypothetical protein
MDFGRDMGATVTPKNASRTMFPLPSGTGPPQWRPLLLHCMRQGGHWLDYDPIAVAVLVIGIAIVMLVALSI